MESLSKSQFARFFPKADPGSAPEPTPTVEAIVESITKPTPDALCRATPSSVILCDPAPKGPVCMPKPSPSIAKPNATFYASIGTTTNGPLEKKHLGRAVGVILDAAESMPVDEPLRAVLDRYCVPTEVQIELIKELGYAPERAVRGVVARFAEAELGKRTLSRFIMSGHGGGDGVSALDSTQMTIIAKAFPKAAASVQHLLLAACYSGHERSVEVWRSAFPNLQTFAGYDRQAPTGEAAVEDIVRFARGGYPQGAAIWTTKKGYRGTQPKETVVQREAVLESLEWFYKRYKTEGKPIEAARTDRNLATYYAQMQLIAGDPRTSSERREFLRARIQEVLNWRHPEMFQSVSP